MGLIESRRGSGNYFTGNISKKFSEMIRMLVQIRLVSQKDICDFRRTMEKSVCASIIQRSDTDLSEMQRLLEATPEDTDELAAKVPAVPLPAGADLRQPVLDRDDGCSERRLSGMGQGRPEKFRRRPSQPYSQRSSEDPGSPRSKGLADACEAAIDEHYDIIEDAMGDESR